jgi:hypothetical protein
MLSLRIVCYFEQKIQIRVDGSNEKDPLVNKEIPWIRYLPPSVVKNVEKYHKCN